MATDKKSERIAVLGAGSWGAALAALLADNGHDVAMWEINATLAQSIASSRQLKVLPDLKLPKSVLVTSDIGEALKGRSVILSVTPSQYVRSTMKTAKASGKIAADAIAISASKGLEDQTLKRMSEVISEELQIPQERMAVLAGPSHAEEVCRRMPTAVVAASSESALSARIQALFTNEYFRVYAHNDMLGVELGGVLKNVFAIACGISDGLGLGDNTKAAIMTRGLNEMTRIGVAQGAQLLTFFGLAGMGDLIVTCTSKHSRNRSFGQKLGEGRTPDQALKEMTMVTEGYQSAPSVYALTQRLKLECPLIDEIYHVLYKGTDPRVSLRSLMARETPSEWEHLKMNGKGRHQ